MKYPMLFLAFSAVFFRGFSQTETTIRNGKTYYVYPHQQEVQSLESLMYGFADQREVLQRDEKNRKVTGVELEAIDRTYLEGTKRRKSRSEKEQETFFRQLLEKRPELFYEYSTTFEQDATPALEPLPDGEYIQYYRDLPYLDGSTIRYRNDVVAGIFTVKNNLVTGNAQWFTATGSLLKTGSYEAGAREGNWNYYSYTPNYAKASTGRNENEIMDYLINGQIEYDTVTESYVFEAGLKNGAYTRISNGSLVSTGFYTNDRESGTWDLYDFGVEQLDEGTFRLTDTLVQVKHYTIADKPQRGRSVIIRDEVIAPEFFYVDEFDTSLKDTSLVLYNQGIMSSSFFEDFSAFYTIPFGEANEEEGLELPEEAVTSYEGEAYGADGYGEYNGSMETMMDYGGYESGGRYINGKYYPKNRLIDTIGYAFIYEGLYEEHYTNGQLKMRFEIVNGTLLKEDTIFWDNGRPANTVVFDATTQQYTEHFFDYRGKLYKTELFDNTGEPVYDSTMAGVNNGEVIIDGITYRNEEALLIFSAYKALETELRERQLIQAVRWEHDSTFCMESYLDPATRTLDVTEYNVQHEPIMTEQAVFGEDYANVNAVTVTHVGDLRFETITSGSLFDFSMYRMSPGEESSDTVLPQSYALHWRSNFDTQSDQVLYYRNQPFNGTFELQTHGSSYKFSSSESSIKIRLPDNETEPDLRMKALKQFRKKGKKAAILALYDYNVNDYGSVNNNVFSLLGFINNFYNQYNTHYQGDQYGYEYGYDFDEYGNPVKRKKQKKTIYPFDKTVTGKFRNGKPDGEWLVKDQFGNITARVFFAKGEQDGSETFYATAFPLTETEKLMHFYEGTPDYLIEDEPKKKLQYISHTGVYKNGMRNGPAVEYDWKGDTTNYAYYKNGLEQGISFQRNKLFYAAAGYEDGMLDGMSRTYLTLPGRDSILIFDLNFQNGALQGESKCYHTNGNLAKRGFFLSGQPIDDYEAFDTLGFRYQYVKFQFNQPVEEKIWEENQLSVRYLFDWHDSIPFQTSDIAGSSSFERLAADLGLIRDPYTEPYYGRPSLLDKTGIDYTITKYYPNDTIAREGKIAKGKKVGHWNYFSYEGAALYEVDYFDTIIALNDSVRFKSKGILTYLDAQRQPASKSWIIEKVEKYDCSHADHNEERMLYTFWERDSSEHRINGYVKNYYDNGVKQNEGWVAEGIPTGVWKLYDSDGNLNQVGTYKQGKRDGRWLSGDLGNVKNMSEICLNPNLTNLEEIMAYQEKLLDVSVIYYGMGAILKREYYGINMNSGEAPDSYYGE